MANTETNELSTSNELVPIEGLPESSLETMLEEDWLEIDGGPVDDPEKYVSVGIAAGEMALRIIAKPKKEGDTLRLWLQFAIDPSTRHDAKAHPFAYADKAGIKDLRNPFDIEEQVLARSEEHTS